MLIEAASTFWRKVKGSELLFLHAERHIVDLPEFFSRLFCSRSLVGEAFRLSYRLRLSVYNCLYLALAGRENCRLVTADAAFFGVLKRRRREEIVQLLEY